MRPCSRRPLPHPSRRVAVRSERCASERGRQLRTERGEGTSRPVYPWPPRCARRVLLYAGGGGHGIPYGLHADAISSIARAGVMARLGRRVEMCASDASTLPFEGSRGGDSRE